MEHNDESSWLSSWEQICVNAIESQPDIENEYENERENCRSFLFNHFQETARSVGHLYAAKRLPDTDEPASLWTPFQLAAASVTSFYRESLESARRLGDAGVALGHARRTRDILSWARRHRRSLIRRDDLIAYLAGKPPPRPHRTSPRPIDHDGTNAEADLDMFREALTGRRSQRGTNSSPTSEQLYALVAAEMARHRKRPASPIDVNMDSPTPHHNTKRQRFT